MTTMDEESGRVADAASRYGAAWQRADNALAEHGDLRLIEAGFPCHQVGAETQREQSVGKQPPTHRLHVWWARRPLTPGRAAILASLLPADADADEFVRRLGIECLVADVAGVEWIIDEDRLRERIKTDADGQLYLPVDKVVLNKMALEQARRNEHRQLIQRLIENDSTLQNDLTIARWMEECRDLPSVSQRTSLLIFRRAGDPAWAKERIELEGRLKIRTREDKYKYPRAFRHTIEPSGKQFTILDPTAGGGSIPFEALRLGHRVVANELNPVANAILVATLDYPARFGTTFVKEIDSWGNHLRSKVVTEMARFFPAPLVTQTMLKTPENATENEKRLVSQEILDGFLYCREVKCPSCNKRSPLLNSFWLSRGDDSESRWAIALDTNEADFVDFRPYQIVRTVRRGKRTYSYGPNGEEIVDEDRKGSLTRTVTDGVGTCAHCQQAIDGDEIKRQARGESEHGRWQDRLYCVAAVRLEPQLDAQGGVQRYASGTKKGQIKTRKVRYFRTPNEADLQALRDAEAELERRRFDFEMKGLVPNEAFPNGNDMRPVTYGMPTWADLFTPRQLLGHLIALDTLNDLKPRILEELGEERGRAVVTYLQFALDKCTDYNSRQTRWEYTRGVIKGGFGRHDFSLKWTFGEMVFSGPNSGLAWGLSQVLDAYAGIAALVEPVSGERASESTSILRGSGSHMPSVSDHSVDAVVMDPPYYDNVQYSELSDFYYVWQRRTLGDLYPGWFDAPVTAKDEEAVANPARDGSAAAAKRQYESLMRGILGECRRVLKPNGLMTLMFTHKSQGAWETLTNALIEANWNITATLPMESEGENSTHQRDMAAAASSIFIACRPAVRDGREPASWSFGGGVKAELEAAVREGLNDFEQLKLNPVDRMVAAWGRALRVYSTHWPVIDGDEPVAPTRAMQEAARVVAEEEVSRLSGGLVTVDDLDAETRVAVIALGINGLGDFAFDDALQVTRSLNVALQMRNGNYRVDAHTVVYANAADGQLAAPLAKKGSRLRLLKPEERLRARLENPQTLWDTLGGLIVTYRDGGIVAARNYLAGHGQRDSDALRGLLKVWANECRDDALRREARLIDYEL